MRNALLVLLLLEGLANAKDLEMDPPEAPPKTGDLAYCPAFSVLSNGHKLSDAGPEWGYFLIERQSLNSYRDMRPRILPVDAQKLTKWAAGQLVLTSYQWDQVAKADQLLRELWGYRCAYWRDAGVKKLLDEARRSYQAPLGIDADSEARLHTAMLDKKKWQETRDQLCRGGTGPFARTVAQIVCDARQVDLDPLQAALDADRDLALARDLYVASCAAPLHYADGRLCQLVAEGLDRVAVRAGLAGLSEPARTLVFVQVEAGLWHLRTAADSFAKMEADSPADKKLVDDVLAEARVLAERIKPWRAQLAELDDWVATLAKGPRALEGCEQRIRPMVQAYVNAVVKQAQGDALMDALHAPGGYGLVQALALCRNKTGDRYGEGALLSVLAKGGSAARGFHAFAGAELNRRPHLNGGVYDGWNLKYLREHSGPGGYVDAISKIYLPRVGNDNGPWATDVIYKVSKTKDGLQVSFKPKSDFRLESYGCRETRQVDSIDSDGRVRYRQVGCKDRKVKFDATPRPLLVPASALLRPGQTIGYTFRVDLRFREDNRPEPADLYFVREGANLVAVAGFSPTP